MRFSIAEVVVTRLPKSALSCAAYEQVVALRAPLEQLAEIWQLAEQLKLEGIVANNAVARLCSEEECPMFDDLKTPR